MSDDNVILLCARRPIFRGRITTTANAPVDAYEPRPGTVILRPASADNIDAEEERAMSDLIALMSGERA